MLRMTGAASAAGFARVSICDGCSVAGNGPHACKTQIVGACVCAISPSCNGYKPLPRYLPVPTPWEFSA